MLRLKRTKLSLRKRNMPTEGRQVLFYDRLRPRWSRGHRRDRKGCKKSSSSEPTRRCRSGGSTVSSSMR